MPMLSSVHHENSVRPIRKSLAEAFLIEGEKALLNADIAQGMEAFDSAIKLDPENPKIYYSQGLCLFECATQTGQDKLLSLASRKLKIATQLSPQFFDAWQVWGSVLCALGLSSNEHHYFKEAKERLNTAIALSKNQSKEALSELYWDLATVFCQLAERSQEALDWHQAVQSFQLAHSFEEELPSSFWNDFGNACLGLANQVNELKFFWKAVQCFKKAVALSPRCATSAHLLAQGMSRLYAMTHDEEHFSQAHAFFQSATELNAKAAEIWIDWAEFLCRHFSGASEIKRLRQCIEICHKAASLDDNDSLIFSIWAEALATLGALTDRLDLIREAERQLEKAISLDPDAPQTLYSSGVCLEALGHYFADEDYYHQAIEKFQASLSIDRTQHTHWYAIAKIYALLGEKEEDEENLKLALRFFQKAIDLFPSTHYLFDQASALSLMGEFSEEDHWLEESLAQFDRLLQLQKNALYIHPHWLFRYACTLDLLGSSTEEEGLHYRAVELFSHVLMVDPDFPAIHHNLGIALSHLGDLTGDCAHFHRAIHHYRLSMKQEEENDVILIDWATTLINLASHSYDANEADLLYKDAEEKLLRAVHLGNLHAYYHLACLYSLTQSCDWSMRCLQKAYLAQILPPVSELLEDAWLDNVRSTAAFQELIDRIDPSSF